MTQYIVTVTAAAALVSILLKLAGPGTMGAIIRLTAGVFMALTVLGPVWKLELPDVSQWIAVSAAEGQAAAAEGEKMGRDTQQAIIKQRMEAYILDKAEAYDAVLEVEVTLDGDGLPASVVLTGPVDPYTKACLTRIIASELGMEKEVQQWIS